MFENHDSEDSPPALYPYFEDGAWVEAAASRPEYLIIVDEELRIHFLSDLQPGHLDVLGTSCLDYIHPDYHPVIRRAVARALETGLPQPYELQGEGPDGQASFYSVWASVVSQAGVRHVALTATDITHLRRIEEKLEVSDETLRQGQRMRALGQLTGGVAHDFNNLLTVIIGSLSLIESSDDSTLTHIAHATAAAERATSLTRRLLSFGRNKDLQLRVVDLNGLLHGFVEVLRRTLGDQVTVLLDGDSPLWPCCLDEAQLESAVLNLAINSRDAMGVSGGQIRLECGNRRLDACEAERLGLDSGDYVQLLVIDNGPGMSEEAKRRAFEPFFTTKEVGCGSGLGLSMVYGFARQSRGGVTLEGQLGEGLTVRLLFPRCEVASPPEKVVPAPVRLPGLAGDGELILVVEDEPAVAQVATQLLALLGYRTLCAESAVPALRLLDENPEVSLLFTDVFLPGGTTGVELAERARALRPDLRVVFTSGYDAGLVEGSRLDQDSLLLVKPYRAKSLGDVIARAFEAD